MHNCIIDLMMGTEMVSETVVSNDLTWLIAQEDFINISHCESIISYSVNSYYQ
jgi:hypothetical protein